MSTLIMFSAIIFAIGVDQNVEIVPFKLNPIRIESGNVTEMIW